MPNKRVVIIMGPPGSGKGTQAELLAEKLNLFYFETSKIIESQVTNARANESVQISGQRYWLKDERTKWQSGILNSPPLVSFWVKNRIIELAKEGRNLILAGSPRTLIEAKEIMPLLEKLYSLNNIKIVLLGISAKESIWRNSHRRICQLMRHPVLYSSQGAKLKTCLLDGSKLIRRKGLDDPKTIVVRLKEYRERTMPIIAYLKEQGIKVKKINGSPAPAIVFKNILKALK